MHFKDDEGKGREKHISITFFTHKIHSYKLHTDRYFGNHITQQLLASTHQSRTCFNKFCYYQRMRKKNGTENEKKTEKQRKRK